MWPVLTLVLYIHLHYYSMVESARLCVASSVLSSKMINASGTVTRFGGEQNVTIQFLTEGVSEQLDLAMVIMPSTRCTCSSERLM